MDETNFEAPKELIKAQKLANITDTAFTIPLIGTKVGWDFIVGLIPGIGDAIMSLVALRIISLARKLGVPFSLQMLMLRNALVDFALGFIPVLGDLIDIFYKANRANVRMMERWWLEQNKSQLSENTQKKLNEWAEKNFDND